MFYRYCNFVDVNFPLQVTLVDAEYLQEYENLNSQPAQELVTKFVTEVINMLLFTLIKKNVINLFSNLPHKLERWLNAPYKSRLCHLLFIFKDNWGAVNARSGQIFFHTKYQVARLQSTKRKGVTRSFAILLLKRIIRDWWQFLNYLQGVPDRGPQPILDTKWTQPNPN